MKTDQFAALDALAASMAPSHRKCISCAEPFASLIRHWLKQMANHPRKPGTKHLELHAHLRDHHGFTGSATAVQQHMQMHETKLYQAAKAR